MATVSLGLRSSSIPLAYHNLRTGSSTARTPSVFRDSVLDQDQLHNKLLSPTLQAANPNLSIIDVEVKLRERIWKKQEDLFMGFQNYDVDRNLSVTRGEFRRVLEAYCLPLTTNQFDTLMSKVTVNPNGTVRYCDFMEKFGARKYKPKEERSTDNWTSASQKYGAVRTLSPKEMNTDMIEKMLKEKIQENMKNVIKGLRLYDYNRDGHIQKHELRKVLENYCFRMNETQFDKLYQRYDFNHRGVINYKEFLQRLGVHVHELNKPQPSDSLPAAFNWKTFADQQRLAKTPQLGINNRQRPGDGNPGVKLSGMELRTAEVDFRKLMKENYTNIKRMFLAFDKHNDGFVQLDDLKAVLSQFTIPMSDQLFSQIMDRCGVNASGKVSWEYFLEKFQDPQSHGNGQTITIKPGHRYNPIRGADVPMGIQEIVKLLVDQVLNGYSSLKQAFLEIDTNRNGKITRKELRKVLDTFNVRITTEQFKELYLLLDPMHSNVISYHRFLDLFEERESVENHKWLKSCHRFNDKQKPLIMAWKTVEEILRNKIQDNWKDVIGCIVNYDTQDSQRIFTHELRRCIERFAIPISDDHFDHLMSKMVSKENKKVDYMEFLFRLGVTVQPGDLHGLSTLILQDSIESEQKRIAEQTRRLIRGEARLLDRTDGMSVSEIIVRLKDHVSQESPKIRKIFLKYDARKNGKVSKRDFRKVLETMSFTMSDSTFEDLCSKLSFTNNVMKYANFLENFEDLRIGGPAAQLLKGSNFRVNAIRGDETCLTATEVESRLRNKLRDNFEDLRAAFYKLDENHKGVVTKDNLRSMLNMFMCPMTDEEFLKLCKRLGITNKSRITYRDFLEKFEVRDTAEGHKWLISDHRFNEVQPVKRLTAEQVHVSLDKKAHQQYESLSKAFRMIDTKKDGVIKKNELRSILNKFTLPMENVEFQKLWLMYDVEGKGYITHEDFLSRLGGNEFAPSDLNGFSHNVIKESYEKLDWHDKKQKVRQQAITMRQLNHVEDMDIGVILQQLKDRIREQYNDFYTAFKKYDTHQRGYLTSNDIQKVLTDLNYFVDDDQFYDLLESMNLHKKRRLSYEDFLEAFEEGRKDSYDPRPENVGMPVTVEMDLPVERAESMLREKASSLIDTLAKAFQAFDQRDSGLIPLPDFRRVLDNFCCKLTDVQFKHVAGKLPITKTGSVDYVNYIQSYKMSEMDADKWIQIIKHRMRTETPSVLTEEEVNAHLAEQVSIKFSQLAKAFTEIDFARIGVVPREEFKEILNKFTIRLNDEQFERLWGSLPVNEFGNLDYTDFLHRFSSIAGNQPRPPTSGPPPATSRLRTAYTGVSAELGALSADRGSVMSNMAAQRSFTPMVNAESVERRLKDVVYRNWKEIQHGCRAADTDNSGQVPYDAFRKIMRRLDGSLVDDDVNTLFLKYDLRNNNHFCYNDFLRHFVLTAHAQRESGLRSRSRLQPIKVNSPLSDVPVVDVATRVKTCIQASWKEIRRDLSKLDKNNSGLVSLDNIRQVLRNYQLNLEENEFHGVMSMFERDLSGQIHYNNFLRAFIQGL